MKRTMCNSSAICGEVDLLLYDNCAIINSEIVVVTVLPKLIFKILSHNRGKTGKVAYTLKQ